MSIMSLGRGNGNNGKRVEPPAVVYPSRPVSKKSESDQLQLGNVTLEAVDRLTGLTADEIEVLADRLMDGARDTEGVLRELARRMRDYGLFANERLANFVRVANTCAEIARTMQATVEKRDVRPRGDAAPDETAERDGLETDGQFAAAGDHAAALAAEMEADGKRAS
jgi:hypothetical protein